MLAAHLQNTPADRASAPALIAGKSVLTFAELAGHVRALAERWRPLAGLRIGLMLDNPTEFVPAVIALDALRCHTVLAGRRQPAEVVELTARLQWDAIIHNLADSAHFAAKGAGAAAYAAPGSQGTVTLLTSGTTGEPKAVSHTWASLSAPVRRSTAYAGARWLCAYPLRLYAGTQVLLQAFLNWSTLVTLISLDPAAVAQTMREAGVTHASGTPSFWRRLLLFAPHEVLKSCRLEQLTLGGEPATQGLLDQLSAVFPQTRLVHIYASTELGRIFSVVDKREGFPAAFLEKDPERGIELRSIEGELFVRSRNAARGGQSSGSDTSLDTSGSGAGWIATGDLVERHGDRVLFRGRKSDIINVGGHKVLPGMVEAILRNVAGVGDVRVYGKRSSLAGQIVAADIVLLHGSREKDVRDEITKSARAHLADYEIPRLVRVVDSIACSNAMKVVRSEDE